MAYNYRSINEVTLMGRVGQQPENKKTNNDISFTHFSLVTKTKFGNDENAEIEPEWHNCSAFSKKADFIINYVNKGDKVFIKGRIKGFNYTDKNNETAVKKGINIQEIQIVDRADKKDNEDKQETESTKETTKGQREKDDDLPF